jgi:L-fuconolactonase
VIVDAHHHVWTLGAHDYSWLDEPPYLPLRRTFDLSDLLPELRAAGVGRTVLVEAGSGAVAETEDFLALAAASPVVAGVVGTVDLTDPSLGDVLDRLRARPGGDRLVGLRHQLQAIRDPAFFDRPDVHDNLRLVADRGLVYDLVVRPDQLPACETLLRAAPGLRYVLDHLGKPDLTGGLRALRSWRGSLESLARLPNVTAKLSGLLTQADPARWATADLRPAVETAVEVFGYERLMFGSDWPVCLLAADYGQVLAATRDALPPMTPDERELVFGGTAQRVYRLEVAQPGRAG